MSTGSASNTAAVVSKGKDKYAACTPKRVDVASVLPNEKREVVWDKLYDAAGIKSSGESTKLSLRCAVYCYLAVNGTSPSGEYSGSVQSGEGHVLTAAAIPNGAGRLDVRRFARSCATESVDYFRMTEVLAGIPAMRAKCEQADIRVGDAIALCDWLDGAEGLTPSERAAQVAMKNFSLSRARAARGGHSVEEIRDETRSATVAAQGPEVKAPSNVW